MYLLHASAREHHAGGRVVALHKLSQPVCGQVAQSALWGNHGLGQAARVGNLVQALHETQHAKLSPENRLFLADLQHVLMAVNALQACPLPQLLRLKPQWMRQFAKP